MPFHLCGFHASIASAADPQDLSAISDDVLSDIYGSFMCASDQQVLAGFALGDSLQQARIGTPALDSLARNPQLRPIVSAAAMVSDPSMAEWFEHPLLIREGEPLRAYAAQNAGAARDAYVLLWLGSELESPPTGPVTTVRGTATTATTANTWTDVALDWSTRLAAGRYAVVGAECVSDNALAFRWKFDGQGSRPGGLSLAALGDKPPHYFSRPSMLGVWGYATAWVMPRLQVLSTAASSDHTVYLQVVRVT